MWTTTRNSLGVRPLRGVHKRYLSGYIAICEFAINLKRVTPEFISTIVTKHYFWTWALILRSWRKEFTGLQDLIKYLLSRVSLVARRFDA
jgi:hypothetical protein